MRPPPCTDADDMLRCSAKEGNIGESGHNKLYVDVCKQITPQTNEANERHCLHIVPIRRLLRPSIHNNVEELFTKYTERVIKEL